MIVDSLRGYTKQALTRDLMAGLIVGIVALPMAIAFAIASGVSPEVGLVTAVLGGLIVSALGGSSVQIGGPTGAFIIIVLGIIGEYGQSGLLIATLMAGILLLLMGALRLGSLIKFIPYPIILGFTAGIAVTIFTTQVNDLFGLGLTGLPKEFVPKWGVLLSSLGLTHLPTLLIGLGSILIIQLTPRLTKVIPGSLVAIVVMTIACYLLKEYAGVTGLDTIGDRYTISARIPDLVAPELSWATLERLIGPAFTIAILGAIESLLSASVADGVIGERHRSNTELMAQGVANIIVPFFGGIPVTGAIARTMTNINNGGRTPLAGSTHAVVLREGKAVAASTISRLRERAGDHSLLLVSGGGEPLAQALKAEPWCAGVRREGADFIVVVSDASAAARSLPALMARGGWDLSALTPLEPSLEDVFTALTEGK